MIAPALGWVSVCWFMAADCRFFQARQVKDSGGCHSGTVR
jgi:hypothetical protein